MRATEKARWPAPVARLGRPAWSAASVLQGADGIVSGVRKFSRKGRVMAVGTTIATPARQRHRSLAVWAIALAAVTIAAVVAVLLATGGHKDASTSSGSAQPVHYNSAAMASIMALTPARFAAGLSGPAMPSRRDKAVRPWRLCLPR